jgi:hypothetical protein
MSDGETHPAPGQSRMAAGYFVAALLVAAIVAALILVLTSADEPAPSPTASAFAPVYEGLEERRLQAGVPTMGEGGGEHFHPLLEIYVRGQPVEVPTNIGIDPAQPPQLMAGLHTHDTTGTIHNEAGTGSTLGQFFAIWGIPFSRDRLGPYEATGEEKVRLWVDGTPSDAYGDLKLEDGQEIVVTFGTEEEPPTSVDAQHTPASLG